MATLKVNRPVEPVDTTLEDGGKILIKCSNCDKPLAYFWQTDKQIPFTSKVKVNCCYCKDASFPVSIEGRFAYGGYYTGEEPDVIGVTRLEFVDFVNDVNIFQSFPEGK